jgi:signal transduction histidine kinase
MIEGSAEDLNLTLNCLIENAVRYSAPESELVIQVQSGGDKAVIKLRDHGMGIPEDIVEKIFSRFYRADYAHSTRGFGLGLPIAQKVIEIHGGTLEVESVVGEGSTFIITLPLAGD